jgi:hypothetical protein
MRPVREHVGLAGAFMARLLCPLSYGDAPTVYAATREATNDPARAVNPFVPPPTPYTMSAAV